MATQQGSVSSGFPVCTATKAVLLTCLKGPSGANNYALWLPNVVDTVGVNFGNIAKIMKTHVAYVEPPIPESAYNPVDIPAGMELTPANRREMWIEANSNRNKLCSKLAEESPKLFRAVWATLSDESRDLVSAVADFADGEAWGANERFNELWAAIRLTHFTNENAGEGAGMVEMNRLVKETNFQQLQQLPGMSIHQFKTEFLAQIASLEAAGLDAERESIKALRFLQKLDKARYGEMMVTLRNQVISMAVQWPQTVDAAYDVAKGWAALSKPAAVTPVSLPVGVGDIGMGAGTFLLSEDAGKTGAAVGSVLKAPKKKPPAVAVTAAGTSVSKGKREDSAELIAARIKYYSLIECDKCHKKGHTQAFCPDNDVTLFTFGLDDEADGEAYSSGIHC